VDQLAEQLIARLRETPNDAAAYGQLKDLYSQAGDPRRLANLMEGYASNTSDTMEASGAYLDAAETVVQMGDDPARAKSLYRQAIHYDVNNETAAAQLQRMFEGAGEWQELAEFLDEYARTLEQAGGAARTLGIMYKRLGELWSNRFDHPETAQAYFDHAYFLDPSLKPEGSRTVAPPNDEAQAMAAHLEMSAEVEGDPARRIQLFTELGQLRAEQLGDIEGAVQALRRALEGAPGDIQVMHQLADYLLRRAALLGEEEAAADYRRVAELFYQIAQGVDQELALTYLHSAV
jgi:tetratricopeptide (TPR) repeat protein